jgi:hypothetical protein
MLRREETGRLKVGSGLRCARFGVLRREAAQDGRGGWLKASEEQRRTNHGRMAQCRLWITSSKHAIALGHPEQKRWPTRAQGGIEALQTRGLAGRRLCLRFLQQQWSTALVSLSALRHASLRNWTLVGPGRPCSPSLPSSSLSAHVASHASQPDQHARRDRR